ncbi:hypothetical protein CDCA_CDCA09G2691 [Cyanidium caldarium]|uniref:FLZ-type domain-containing protein n=1 Tax=Cyanidium caldarium TaxID=2771 RepID=A0AAV9IX64_CYACA|nr:hypothetical protein CDCA_CDCA09G2691 [Cyanidium caldarium]|eukprot:ctg_390.g211
MEGADRRLEAIDSRWPPEHAPPGVPRAQSGAPRRGWTAGAWTGAPARPLAGDLSGSADPLTRTPYGTMPPVAPPNRPWHPPYCLDRLASLPTMTWTQPCRCEFCGVLHNGEFASGRFCSVQCSRRCAASAKWKQYRFRKRALKRENATFFPRPMPPSGPLPSRKQRRIGAYQEVPSAADRVDATSTAAAAAAVGSDPEERAGAHSQVTAQDRFTRDRRDGHSRLEAMPPPRKLEPTARKAAAAAAPSPPHAHRDTSRRSSASAAAYAEPTALPSFAKLLSSVGLQDLFRALNGPDAQGRRSRPLPPISMILSASQSRDASQDDWRAEP